MSTQKKFDAVQNLIACKAHTWLIPDYILEKLSIQQIEAIVCAVEAWKKHPLVQQCDDQPFTRCGQIFPIDITLKSGFILANSVFSSVHIIEGEQECAVRFRPELIGAFNDVK